MHGVPPKWRLRALLDGLALRFGGDERPGGCVCQVDAGGGGTSCTTGQVCTVEFTDAKDFCVAACSAHHKDGFNGSGGTSCENAICNPSGKRCTLSDAACDSGALEVNGKCCDTGGCPECCGDEDCHGVARKCEAGKCVVLDEEPAPPAGACTAGQVCTVELSNAPE